MSDHSRRIASRDDLSPSDYRQQSSGLPPSQARPAGHPLSSARHDPASDQSAESETGAELSDVIRQLLRAIPSERAKRTTSSADSLPGHVAGFNTALPESTITLTPGDKPRRETSDLPVEVPVSSVGTAGQVSLSPLSESSPVRVADGGAAEKGVGGLLSASRIDEIERFDRFGRPPAERTDGSAVDPGRGSDPSNSESVALPPDRLEQISVHPPLNAPVEVSGLTGIQAEPSSPPNATLAIPLRSGATLTDEPDSQVRGGASVSTGWPLDARGEELGPEGQSTSVVLRDLSAISGSGFDLNSMEAGRRFSADGFAQEGGSSGVGNTLTSPGGGQGGQDTLRTNAILEQILDEIRRLVQPPLISSARAVYPER